MFLTTLLLSVVASPSTIVRGATLIPMTEDGPRLLEDHAIVFEDGKITWVGPTSEAPTHAARAIDGEGLFVVPGLIDSHAHLFDESQLQLWLANGVTSVFNLSGTPFVLDWREGIRAKSMVGPTIITSGPQVKESVTPPFDIEARLPEGEDIERFVTMHRELGYDFVKVWSSISPPQYEALMSECRRQGVRVTGHIPARVNLRGVVASGQRSIAHVEEILNKFFVRDLSESGLAPLRTIAEEEDFVVISTLITYEMIADTLEDERLAARLARPENRFIDPALLALWGSEQNDWWKLRRASRPEGYYDDALAFKVEIVRVLHEAGIPVLAGSDAGLVLANILPGFSLHRELQILSTAGLSPHAVLASATSQAGEFLDPGSKRGTLSAGAPADLLFLRENPLIEVGEGRSFADSIEAVVAAGNHMDRDSLDSMLAAVENEKLANAEFWARVEVEGLEDAASAATPGAPTEATLLFAAYHKAAAEETDDAARFAELACRLYPESYRAHLFLGGVNELGSRTDEAHQAYRRVLELRPDHWLIERRLSQE